MRTITFAAFETTTPSGPHRRVLTTKSTRRFCVAAMVFLISAPVLAQTRPETQPTDGKEEKVASESSKADRGKQEQRTDLDAESFDQFKKLTDTILEENRALNERVTKQDAIIAEQANKNEELTSRIDDIEEADLNEEIKNNDLKIYGFADVGWYKFILDDNSRYKGQWNDKNSFTVGHWNTYFDKQIGKSFRFLGEVRFLFQPYGDEISYEGMDFDGNQLQYARAQTRSFDPVDQNYFDWGGISIERVWIEYKYSDLFAVRVGNFLTPYGIWNIDHASTVVIPGHRPFLITAKLIPESQTGFSIYGRVFPSEKTTINYALTLSNGRGPTTRLYDLDENKAAGLSLSFKYDGAVGIDLGTYLYIGEYTDITRRMAVDAAGRINTSADIFENYIEKAFSVHLKFTWEGLLLQGEYARGLIKYKDPGRFLFFEEGAFGPTTYLANYIQQAGYALIAYKLPVDVIHLTPYFIYEFQEPSDFSDLPQGHNFGGGLNWRIVPQAVLKIDYIYHRENGERWNFPASKLHYSVISTQLAVAF